MRIFVDLFLATMLALSFAAFCLLPSAPDAWSIAGCLGLSGAFAAIALGAACLFAE